MNQKIDSLNEKEVDWLQSQREGASKFVKEFSPSDSEMPLTLGALDRAFANWMSSDPRPESINDGITYVGIAFGQTLVDGLGLNWVFATDDQGTDLAVYGLPGRGDVLIYPANFVAKRWERRETNFLEWSYEQIAADIRALVKSWEKKVGDT